MPEPVEELPTQAVVEPEVEIPAIDDEPKTVAATPVVAEPEAVLDTTPAPAIDAPSQSEPQESVSPSDQSEPEAEGKSVTIWEIFGVPRPSETQETDAVGSKIEPIAEPVGAEALKTNAAEAIPSYLEQTSFPRGSTRVGLRIVLRRRLVRVRRP